MFTKFKLTQAQLFSIILLALVACVWLAYRPDAYVNIDEHNYLSTASKLARGQSLLTENPDYELGTFENHEGYHISKYNLGNSFYLAPFTLVSSEFVFVSGLLALVMLVIICQQIIKELKLNPYWHGLIILFPPFIYFSRTLLSELPAAVLVALSYLAYLRRRSMGWLVILGLSLGMMVLVRYNLALWVIIILLTIAWEQRNDARKTIKPLLIVCASALPFLILFLIINNELYGGFLASGYKYSGEEKFQLSELTRRLPWYILILNIFYPGQFIISWISSKALMTQTALISLIFILFYSVAGGFLFEQQLTDVIVGIRFFVPLLPLVLMQYFAAIETIAKKLKFEQLNLLILCSWIPLIILALVLSSQHQAFLPECYNCT